MIIFVSDGSAEFVRGHYEGRNLPGLVASLIKESRYLLDYGEDSYLEFTRSEAKKNAAHIEGDGRHCAQASEFANCE